MSRSVSPCPAELEVQRLIATADHITLVLRVARREVPCPGCAQPSRRIHSYYDRQLADLPWNGVPSGFGCERAAFFVTQKNCAYRIFTERLSEATATYSRRTLRMQQALCWLGLALGGEAGASTEEGICNVKSLLRISDEARNWRLRFGRGDEIYEWQD